MVQSTSSINLATLTETPKQANNLQLLSPVQKFKQRTANRISEVNNTDFVYISKSRADNKYLPHTSNLLPDPRHIQDDIFTPPSSFLEGVLKVARLGVPTPSKPSICFSVSPEAIQQNTKQLQNLNFDLTQLINSQQHKTMGFGSEF